MTYICFSVAVWGSVHWGWASLLPQSPITSWSDPLSLITPVLRTVTPRWCVCVPVNMHVRMYESRGWHQVSSSMTFTFTFFETGSLTKPVVGQWAAAILLSPTPQCWAHRIYILPWVKANVTVTHAVPKQVISAIEAGRRCWHGVADLLGSRCLCEFQLMSSLPHFLTVSDRLTAAVQPGLEAKGEQSSCRDTSAGDTDILQLAGG